MTVTSSTSRWSCQRRPAWARGVPRPVPGGAEPGQASQRRDARFGVSRPDGAAHRRGADRRDRWSATRLTALEQRGRCSAPRRVLTGVKRFADTTSGSPRRRREMRPYTVFHCGSMPQRWCSPGSVYDQAVGRLRRRRQLVAPPQRTTTSTQSRAELSRARPRVNLPYADAVSRNAVSVSTWLNACSCPPNAGLCESLSDESGEVVAERRTLLESRPRPPSRSSGRRRIMKNRPEGRFVYSDRPAASSPAVVYI